MGTQVSWCKQGLVVSLVWFALGALLTYSAQQLAAPAGGGGAATTAATAAATTAAHIQQQQQPAKIAADRHHQVPCPPPRQPGTKRRNLVFAAVGEGWTADKWGFSEQVGWDLIAVYYGNASTPWECPQCTLALRMPDAMKWQMVWALMTDRGGAWKGVWQNLRDSYDYVMVADDDLIMDACVIDVFFQSMRRHGLLAAQPSNCRGDDSDNPYWVHWQLPGMELHYVNVVEVTAPGLEMKYLDTRVRPLLERTFSGWGLPFCFTAAAGFPTGKLAAIDSVCMIHPAREPVGKQMTVSERIRKGLIKPGSIYARFGELTPFDSPLEEQRALWKECGFTEAAAFKARQPYPPTQTVHGTVLAKVQQDAGAGASIAAGAAEQQGAAAAEVQQQGAPLAVLGDAAQQQREVLLRVVQLGVAAAAGAALTLLWSRRAKGSQAPRQILSVHASPRW